MAGSPQPPLYRHGTQEAAYKGAQNLTSRVYSPPPPATPPAQPIPAEAWFCYGGQQAILDSQRPSSRVFPASQIPSQLPIIRLARGFPMSQEEQPYQAPSMRQGNAALFVQNTPLQVPPWGGWIATVQETPQFQNWSFTAQFGPSIVTILMPNLIGLDLQTAIAVLAGYSLTANPVVYEDTVYPEVAPPRGIVLGQWPLAGTAIPSGLTNVLLIVSSGLMNLPKVGDSVRNPPNIVIGSTDQ